MPINKTTRNAKGGGTIRQRSDGRWEARYTAGRDPGTGRQVQRSVYGKTQAEVRKKLTQAVNSIDEGLYIEPNKLTVSSWLDTWLKEYLGNVKPRTVDSYKSMCENHLKPNLGAIKLSKLDTPTIQKLYNQLYKGTGGKQVSARTLKNIHGVLHKALKQAVLVGYLKFNASDSCILPKFTKKEIQPLEDTEISAFMEAVQGHKYETVYHVTLFTGMRQGEVLGLSWECVDFNRGTILVNKQLQLIRGGGGHYVLLSTKNDKSRLITPAPSVMQALRAWRAKQTEWQLKAGQAWQNQIELMDTGKRYELVFTNEIGRYLSPLTVYKNYKKIVDSIGIPEARFHDLRHSFAVVSLQSGDDIKTVQENLGHHAAAFTLDTYAHVTEKMKNESANRMENYIKEMKKS